MIAATATATEMQNNFGKYLNIVLNGDEVLVTKNGKNVGRFVPVGKVHSFLTDSLAGVLENDFSFEDELETILRENMKINDEPLD